MKRTLSRIWGWVAGLDAPSRVSALLCPAPLILSVVGAGPSSADFEVEYSAVETVFQWLLVIPAGLLMAPVVGASQFGLFSMVRHGSVRWLQWTLCAVSALLLVPYQRFIATADLTSTSTAAVGLAIFPLYLALFALPPAWLGWWIVEKVVGRRRQD